jgi:hypothetical protein
MNSITIPSPQYKSRKNRTENDHPTPIVKINYVGSPQSPAYRHFAHNRPNITLIYPHSITIQPFEKQTIYFPVLVESSLPTQSIIYGTDLLFRYGLTSQITIIPSDSLLFTVIKNNMNKPLSIPKNRLSFNCLTVVATIEDYND